MNGSVLSRGVRLAFTAVFVTVFLAMALATSPALAITSGEPLSGIAPASPSQLEAELYLRNPNHIHPYIAALYYDWGIRYGIRSDLAFAQMLHETDSLHYGGDVQPWQNNFAGIGATGGGNRGYSYSSAEAGVIAHYEHLASYIRNRGVRYLRDLDGKWAVPGVGYGDAIARYATEMYYFTVNGHWKGSFNEVSGTSSAELSTRYYFTWYDSRPENGMVDNWILVGNAGAGAATVEIRIGGQKMRDPANPANDFFAIPEGGRIAPSFRNFIGGPVEVISTSGQPLIASQRVLFRDAFNEVAGFPAERLTDSYEFTWYDSLRQNWMEGNWVLVANKGAEAADVEIMIGGAVVAEYKAASGNALAPGAIVTPQFPGVMNGPVTVRSTNGQSLIVSQRVLYKESFSEVMGYPTAALETEYMFAWYDSMKNNGMNGDWVLVANRGTGPADVDIYVAGILMARYSTATGNAIAAGGMVTPQFPSLVDGPVRVVSTNGQPVMVSQRGLHRDSIEEVQGMPATGLAADQWFAWYDSLTANSMWGDWVLVANSGSGTATVEIYINGVKMRDPANTANDFFTIPEGGRITPQFANTIGGPVRVVCTSGQPLTVSQRVLYKYGPILVNRWIP